MVKETRKEAKVKRFLGTLITGENRNKIISETRKKIMSEAFEKDETVVTFEEANEQARAFVRKEQRHLKAFIKGKTYYRSGVTKTMVGDRIVSQPNIYVVQFNYTEE